MSTPMPETTNAASADDLQDAISKALRRAYQLGQTYWRLADSESWSDNKKLDEIQTKFDALVEETRAALSTAGAEPTGWTTLPGQMPAPGTAVLLDIGKKTPIRAMWAAKHTVEAHDEADLEWSEYDGATDKYYCPEGWYEWNEHEETHWLVHAEARAWMSLPLVLPPAPKE